VAHRLPSRFEFQAVRSLCKLPPRVQRRLFGPPPKIDGQELATDLHVLLKLAERVGDTSLSGGFTGEEMREHLLRGVASTAGPKIEMAATRELSYPGPGGEMPARIYLPLGAEAAPRPLLVYFFGGGFSAGSLDTHDGVCRFLAAHSGVTVLAPSYRLAPEHPFPAAVEDAAAAFPWAIANAASFGADPRRIAIGGDSAGANLAAGVCLTMRDVDGPQAAMQLLICPPTDAGGEQRSRKLFARGFRLTQEDIELLEPNYFPDESMALDSRASILRVPDLSRLPSAYVATAGFDPLRDEGEEYATRLRQAGVPVALRRHPRQIHTFPNLTAICPSSRAAMLETAGALRMGLAA
jgi:acetyl esterase